MSGPVWQETQDQPPEDPDDRPPLEGERLVSWPELAFLAGLVMVTVGLALVSVTLALVVLGAIVMLASWRYA